MPTFSSVSSGFNKFVRYRIDNDAQRVIPMIAPIVTLEELYNGFGVDEETKKDMLKLDKLMQRYNNKSYSLRLQGFDTVGAVLINMDASLPRQYETLTASSVFAPVFKITQEWSILYYVVDQILPLIGRTAISGVFPWIPDLIREEEYSFEKNAHNRKFCTKYGISLTEKPKLHSCMVAAMRAPKYMPVVPTAVRDAIRLGNKLYTQLRLLQNRPKRQIDDDTQITIMPRIDSNYVPYSVRNAVQEMRDIMRNPHFGYGEE